jgi:hypothetical protein
MALVRTGVSEERIACITNVERITELGITLLSMILYILMRGDTFLRNVGSYKSLRASNPSRRHSLLYCKVAAILFFDCSETTRIELFAPLHVQVY